MSTPCVVSFVIPARDESATLPRLVTSIQDHTPKDIPYEIIVVDNGSADETPGIATAMGCALVTSSGRSIASVRNRGAEAASGRLLVFLDADCELTAEWQRRTKEVVSGWLLESEWLSGSWVVPPPQASWIERCWFAPLGTVVASHVNSAHLIVPRQTFARLGGFDESLTTGEDYEFSQRARTAGCRIIPDQHLQVVHHGYPKTLAELARREAWHGLGDYSSLCAAVRSKVVIASNVFVAILGVGVALTLSGGNGQSAALLLLAAALIPLGLAILRFRELNRRIGQRYVVMTTYLIARSILGRFYQAFRNSWRGARRT